MHNQSHTSILHTGDYMILYINIIIISAFILMNNDHLLEIYLIQHAMPVQVY